MTKLESTGEKALKVTEVSPNTPALKSSSVSEQAQESSKISPSVPRYWRRTRLYDAKEFALHQSDPDALREEVAQFRQRLDDLGIQHADAEEIMGCLAITEDFLRRREIFYRTSKAPAPPPPTHHRPNEDGKTAPTSNNPPNKPDLGPLKNIELANMSSAEIASNVAYIRFRASNPEYGDNILDGIHPILLKRASVILQEELESPELRGSIDVKEVMEWKSITEATYAVAASSEFE